MAKYPKEALTGVTPAVLSWMTGVWKGQRGADIIEEHWSALGGGALIGMFRWQKGETNWLYEFIAIEAENNQILLRIKHFNPGLKGWEEKDESTTFLLVQAHEQQAVFFQINKPDGPWMIYRLENENQLVAYFEKEDSTPKDEDKFLYTRQQL